MSANIFVQRCVHVLSVNHDDIYLDSLGVNEAMCLSIIFYFSHLQNAFHYVFFVNLIIIRRSGARLSEWEGVPIYASRLTAHPLSLSVCSLLYIVVC